MRDPRPAGNKWGLQTTSHCQAACALDVSQPEKLVPRLRSCRAQAQTPCPSPKVSILLHVAHLWAAHGTLQLMLRVILFLKK